MNLTNLILWSATIIAGLTGAFKIEAIQMAVWKAQAKIIYESRTETWGSPDFLRAYSQNSHGGLKPKKP